MSTDEPMTFEEFEKALRYADWRYEYSDDQRAWRSGMRQIEKLRNMAMAMGGAWQEAFDAAWQRAK